MKKKILIVSNSDAENDPRVEKQIRFLADDYSLIVISTSANARKISGAIEDCFTITNESTTPHYLQSRQSLITKLYIKGLKACKAISHRTRAGAFYSYHRLTHVQQLRKILPNIEADIVIVNEIDCLPIVCDYFHGKNVIFDAHEYAPREFEDSFGWRLVQQPLITRLCDAYIPKVKILTTVSEGIASEYRLHYPTIRTEIITSAAWSKRITPKPSRWPLRLIHHGVALSSRRLENMILAMNEVDDYNKYELHLMLVPSDKIYYGKLVQLANQINDYVGRKIVTFMRPVAMSDIIDTITDFDVQVITIPPTNFNYKYALPNKFFEAIQARNALLVGPMPELARIVEKNRIGVLAKNFTPSAIANAVNQFTPAVVDRFKRRVNRLAKTVTAEKNQARLKTFVSELVA
ncbi:MAG: hypothetical protein JSR44_05405 [Spirochaetes bacterium]|nr:hypothetical protein [Spirochaetota bacterium]